MACVAGALALAAACLADMGQPDEAKRYLEMAERVEPGHVRVRQVGEALRNRWSGR